MGASSFFFFYYFRTIFRCLDYNKWQQYSARRIPNSICGISIPEEIIIHQTYAVTSGSVYQKKSLPPRSFQTHRSQCVVPSPPGHSRRPRASLTKQSSAALGAMSFIIFPPLFAIAISATCALRRGSLEKQCFNLNVSQIYIKHGLRRVWRTYA